MSAGAALDLMITAFSVSPFPSLQLGRKRQNLRLG